MIDLLLKNCNYPLGRQNIKSWGIHLQLDLKTARKKNTGYEELDVKHEVLRNGIGVSSIHNSWIGLATT